MARAAERDGRGGLAMMPPRTYPRFAPWWSPWGFVLRLTTVVNRPSDLYWLSAIGWFVLRLPTDMEQSHLSDFLARLASAGRPSAADPIAGAERVIRLRAPWLRAPWFRTRDTCYVRALTLYRFVDPAEHDLRLRVGAEWFDRPGGVLRGHAWVTIDGEILEPPLDPEHHRRLLPIHLAHGERGST